MPAPATTDEFLDLVRKSGVVDEARVKSFLSNAAGQPLPADPNKLAGQMVRDGLLTYFQADQLLQGKWKRFFIGKYKVLERIGTGGMGQVFLCEHKLMRRRVAVKVLPAAKAADPAALERFYREARAVAALDHPNIVRAYDIDQDENLHFLVMEFVDGTNLQDLVKKVGALDPVRASHYVYGASVGLQHAHEMGLVHRDIKPGNILIDRAGVVKILDLGLARFFNNTDEDDDLTRKYDESILGTADYLAPEQAIDSHTVDIRADVYSLGGTFYYLLSGRPPFPEGSVAQKLLWHQVREPVPVRGLRPDLPADLADVVARMMAKKPEDRFQSPAEIMAALAPWVQSPIPPPDEREIPQLSPAAAGAGAGPVTSRIITTAPTVAGAPASGGGAFATPPAGIRSDVLGGSTPAGPMPVVAPATVQQDVVWDELTAETRGDAKADTARTRPGTRSGRTPARQKTDPGRKGANRTVLYAVVGAVAVLGIVVGGAVGYFAFFRGKQPPVTAPGEPKTWYVSRTPGPDPDRTLATLRGAFDQAGPDDRIVILDDRLDEPPVALTDAGGKKKGVKIEAGNLARSVAWAPRGTRPAALEIGAVENLRVSGLVLELGGQLDTGVAIVRGAPGMVIENVTVRGPKGTGFRLVGCAGDTGRGRALQVVRCRVAAEEKIDAAVLLTDGARDVVIAGNRLEGPGGTAIRVVGAVQDVEVRNNRVFKFETGVQVLATPRLTPEAPFSLTVANNTFHTLTAAGLSTDTPLGGKQQLLALTKNYFAATKQIATSTAPAVPGLKASENARDPATKEGKVLTKSVEVNAALPVDPASEAFLRPGKPVPQGAQPE